MKILMRYKGYRRRALTLSYDDGVKSDIKLIEILNKYNARATFNLNSGLFGVTNKYDERLSGEECQKLYKDPSIEIASHTLTHPNLASMSYCDAKFEILNDKKALEKLFNRPVSGFAYPFGAFNDMTTAILKELGFKYARTTKATNSFKIPDDFLALGPTCRHRDSNLFILLDRFLNDKSNEPLLFYLWGHSYEFKNDNSYSLIDEFLNKCSKANDIWFATNLEVVEYVNAFRGLKINNSVIYNPSDIDLYCLIDNRPCLIGSHESFKI